ncbi:hypothetical protein, partial [Solemya elarraichensis gill symbiont]
MENTALLVLVVLKVCQERRATQLLALEVYEDHKVQLALKERRATQLLVLEVYEAQQARLALKESVAS